MPEQRFNLCRFVSARCQWLVWLCTLGALTAPVSRLLPAQAWPRLQWLVELAAHWQWAYAAVGGLALGALVLLRGRRSGWRLLIAAVVLGGCSAWQAGTLQGAAQPPEGTPVLTVGTANLNLATTDFTALLQWLASADAPDVVMLQEFTELAQNALESHPEVAARYPHRLLVPQPDPFGLAVLSRQPLTHTQTLQPHNDLDTLRLRATLAWQGKTVQLAALHPMPPLSEAFAQARDRALMQEALHIQQTGDLGVMAGDLNTTPWARGLFAVDAHMRRANSAEPSWPNAWAWLSVLPLDHVLASPGWQVVSSRMGPDLGSDHRPVVVRLAVSP